MPETLQPFEVSREALAEKLKLKDQWTEQVKALNETGVLEILPESQDIGIVDLRGRECPIPKYEEILAEITAENLELLQEKAEQGFNRLLLVPLGLPLNILTERYQRELLKHHREGTLLDTSGNKLDLDPDDPFYVWHEGYDNADINGNLVYFPQQFTQENHGGQTKDQLLKRGDAWQILLLEDLPDLPAKGGGTEKSGRKQLEASQSSEQYLKKMQEEPPYQGEQGLTPEAWLTYAISQLHQKNIQIDDYDESRGGKGKASFLIGSWFPTSEDVPRGVFSRGNRQACLYGNYPHNSYSNSSCRSSVKIQKP